MQEKIQNQKMLFQRYLQFQIISIFFMLWFFLFRSYGAMFRHRNYESIGNRVVPILS